MVARSAVEEHARLSGGVLAGLEVGLLHGQMPTAQKKEVMDGFRDGGGPGARGDHRDRGRASTCRRRRWWSSRTPTVSASPSSTSCGAGSAAARSRAGATSSATATPRAARPGSRPSSARPTGSSWPRSISSCGGRAPSSASARPARADSGWPSFVGTASGCERAREVAEAIVDADPELDDAPGAARRGALRPSTRRTRPSSSRAERARWSDHERFGFDPGSVFDGVAASYQATRPSYPDGPSSTPSSGIVGPLSGRRVVDVGAGTGISARALAARGATGAGGRPEPVDGPDPARRLGAAAGQPGSGRGAPGRRRRAPTRHLRPGMALGRVPAAAPSAAGARAGGTARLWWNVREDEPGPFFDDLGTSAASTRYGVGAHQDDRESLVGVGGFSDLVRDVGVVGSGPSRSNTGCSPSRPARSWPSSATGRRRASARSRGWPAAISPVAR